MIHGLRELSKTATSETSSMKAFFRGLPSAVRGLKFARSQAPATGSPMCHGRNPLEQYFNSHSEGPGVWKWQHYLEVYHRHFAQFVRQEVHVCEIGVYSGGSLQMWRDYFGERCHLHGVDIQAACKLYENDRTTIDLGDQADREFWRQFRARHPILDIVIDDGGHEPEQQMVTLEELLPHLRPGGVFVCEDVYGEQHFFADFIHGLAANLNRFQQVPLPPEPEGLSVRCSAACQPSAMQSQYSVHLYPYIAVIEKRAEPLMRLAAERRGTSWQPFIWAHHSAVSAGLK